MSAAAGYGEYMLAVTSSHFGSAENRVSFSAGICQSETAVGALDSDRERRVSLSVQLKNRQGTNRISTKTARCVRRRAMSVSQA